MKDLHALAGTQPSKNKAENGSKEALARKACLTMQNDSVNAKYDVYQKKSGGSRGTQGR
jgi:hypothetical protein